MTEEHLVDFLARDNRYLAVQIVVNDVLQLEGVTCSIVFGDADMDGDVDVFDWVKVKRIILGIDT